MNFIGAWFPHTKEPQRSELTLDAVMSPLKNEKLFGKTYIYIELFGIKSSADFWILYGGFVGSQLIWPKSVRNNALPLRSRAVVLCQRSPKRPRAVSPGGFQSISTPKCRTTSSPGTEQKKEKLFAFWWSLIFASTEHKYMKIPYRVLPKLVRACLFLVNPANTRGGQRHALSDSKGNLVRCCNRHGSGSTPD